MEKQEYDLENKDMLPFNYFNQAIDILNLGGTISFLEHVNSLPYLYNEIKNEKISPSFYSNEYLTQSAYLELSSQIFFVCGDIIRLQAFNLYRQGFKEALEKL